MIQKLARNCLGQISIRDYMNLEKVSRNSLFLINPKKDPVSTKLLQLITMISITIWFNPKDIMELDLDMEIELKRSWLNPQVQVPIIKKFCLENTRNSQSISYNQFHINCLPNQQSNNNSHNNYSQNKKIWFRANSSS